MYIVPDSRVECLSPEDEVGHMLLDINTVAYQISNTRLPFQQQLADRLLRIADRVASVICRLPFITADNQEEQIRAACDSNRRLILKKLLLRDEKTFDSVSDSMEKLFYYWSYLYYETEYLNRDQDEIWVMCEPYSMIKPLLGYFSDFVVYFMLADEGPFRDLHDLREHTLQRILEVFDRVKENLNNVEKECQHAT